MLRIRSLVLIGALAALQARAQPARSVVTNDGLAIRLESAGTLQGLTLDGTPVDMSPETGGFYVTEFFAPDGRRRDWGIVCGRTTQASDGVELLAPHRVRRELRRGRQVG